RFSRAEDKAKAAKDYVLDSVRISNKAKANLHAKAELGWWSKTIGTQLNTAKKFKDFDRVYKLLQRLLQHQSSDVMDALEVAPTLLEKLDDWQDLKNQVKAIGRNAWQGLKHKVTDAVTDRMAVAKVIFGETLAKKPLSQAELEQKLTPQQLKIYEEARAAINVSLKNTAKSEIIRSLLQNDVINFDTVEKLLNQQTGFDEFIDEMLENVGARISNAQEELSQAETDVEKQAIKDELKRLADMYNSISDVNTKVYKLIDEAYAPLMRFGDYALTMRDKTTGKVLSFMMFESKAERNRMVNYLGTEYGDTVTLETDTMSTEDFKMFKGVTPETVALFAKELGLDKNEAYQGYLKLAIPATSALTRRIQRKGTAGYNEDIQRVVSAFVMSNARYSAKNIYLAKADREISEIESGASVRDQAKKMRDNTIDPVDTFAWLRDLLFVWNLGGSVMFAFLNMTQPFLQTIPMLSQYVNTSFATKHVWRGIGVAGKAMATGNAPKGYEAEYKRAVHEGVVDPQNTFMLTGLERGGTGTTSKVWTGTKHILGIFAQMSESLNRKAVFIASLEVANAKGGAWLKQKGYASAYDFAVDVIAQTQGVYNKANRSNWAHNPVGAPLLVFKQFSINYVEQMIRMWKNQSAGEEGKKAVLLAMMMLFSLAGGMGLPFIKDIFDGSETIAAFMGNPINIEREMRLMGKQYLGETTTGALMDGWLNKLVIGEVLGADVQSRTGMGDLIPATNFFNKTIYGTDQQVKEGMSIFGAAGGLGDKVGDSLNFMANDEWGDAFINILPRFATSMYRGVEMMTTGETTDSKGRKLFDTTFGEGLVKFLDSQPVRMAELSRARGMEYADIAIQRSKIDYYRKKWIKAAMDEDFAKIEEIEQDIADWNEENEKYPVIFDRQRAYQSANKNEMTWGEREERTPKGMEWLNEERPDWLNEQ
ncbi:MAG TPA: PLxRFG domain-containing protein, partial [Agitococcus sp.]|nr:PLxRFG domain-containing protein [Agitococcus sp.]